MLAVRFLATVLPQRILQTKHGSYNISITECAKDGPFKIFITKPYIQNVYTYLNDNSYHVWRHIIILAQQ